MKTTMLHEAWKSYFETVDIDDIDEERMQELWIAFHCGACATWAIASHPRTTSAILEALAAEIAAFRGGPPTGTAH